MEITREPGRVISSLRNVNFTSDMPSNVAKNVSSDLNKLLTSVNGLSLLKEQSKNLEVVLPCFIRLIFHSDVEIAESCLKLCDTVLDIFRSHLPKIKKEGWWMSFENGALLTLIDTLISKIDSKIDSWVAIWTFLANIVVTEAFHVKTLNRLLAVTQHAFQKGRDNMELKDQALLCWRGLIDAFGRSPQILVLNKAINLLIKPLSTLSSATKCQIDTWVHLIEVKGLSGPGDIVNSIVQAMCKAMFKSGEKSTCRTLPDDCLDAIIKILAHDHVKEYCLSDVIEVFGACVNSKPSAKQIEQLAGVIVQSINDLKDDGISFKLWKALLEQHSSTSGSTVLSASCQTIYTGINFCRWVDSNTIGGKDITLLMASEEFRDKVLLRSIQALSFDDQAETPNKKKSRKGSYENVWSNYCEAYISWWSNCSPSSNENEKLEKNLSLKDRRDYKATRFLLLQPIQLDIWNTTIFKTWSLLCEVCHSQSFLCTFVDAIFAAADKPNFQLQKAIDVSDCLYKLDNEFSKQSTKLLESISNVIFSMEFQNLLDVLNLLETAVLFPEMSTLVNKVCKSANEKVNDLDQLNAHKIKTKVTKITRKLELHTSSTENDRSVKTQRTPFRTQSNFLQRLAKAEEKNKTKSPFLTSLFSSSENVKNDLGNNDDPRNDGTNILDTLHENGVEAVDSKPLDNSEVVPIITLPSVLKCSQAAENGHTETIVAEKENVILSAVNGANGGGTPTVGSPKLKITNAREVKTVDASSPTVAKKPKPMAGQKSTPKKVTPTKVSYFDDEANDCVMVPPKPKTTPLTEHQLEVMYKRRTDIPALYQDLSQDTQSQHIPIVHEVTTVHHPSPRPFQESQDIVLGTPSPQNLVVVSTPEPLKPAGKTCSSAKKLDFNHLSTPPSKTSFMNGSFEKMSPTPEHELKGENSEKLGDAQPVQPKNIETPADVFSSSNKLQTKSNGTEKNEGSDKSGADDKSKRKRKSEPAKFSPKLTRSKRSLKSSTPDAKLTASDLKGLAPVDISSNGDKLARPESPEPPRKKSECLTGVLDTKDKKPTFEEKKCDDTLNNGHEEEHPVSRQLAEDDPPNSQNVTDQTSQEKPKKCRKRKTMDTAENETPKKVSKNSSEEGCSATKKKKKKPFKLAAGGKLENWLVKVDKVSTPATEPFIKCEKVESDDETAPEKEKNSLEPVSNTEVDLDNSEEIVPSTQECLVHNNPVLPVLETKMEEKHCHNGEAIKTEEKDPDVAVPDSANGHSPEKREGSVLERLSHESPNDEDVALVISPSKRQRRAPSVFRGEGDTYLSKDKFYSTPSAEQDEDSKLSRAKNKTASPTSKKRLQPLGGRSAKMLRLATTSTNQEDSEDIVVTPLRRRDSIVPTKYGENWPKGHVEEWVACAPASPYMSPFRSALKKTPGLEENTTPQRVRNDSMASPLLSSAKRKRVMFLDPPVTRGLTYDTNSPGGSIHHADVPPGSPYPTWKSDDDPRPVQDDVKMEFSPSKRDAERLNSLADLKPDVHKENIKGEAANFIHGEVDHIPQLDLKPCATDVSDEVRQLIGLAVPTTSVPSPEPDFNQIQEKFKLSEDFMTVFTAVDAHLRSLLVQCFDCADMAETVDSWKMGDCRRICQLPYSFLSSVKNTNGEILAETLACSLFTVPSNQPPLEFSASSAQTEETFLTETSSQTSSPSTKDSDSQTIIKSRSVKTNTDIVTTTSSTQADLTRPAIEEWPSLLKDSTPQEALMYFSDSLRVLSSSLSEKK